MTWRGPLTWFGWLNFLVLQWFGVRLARKYRVTKIVEADGFVDRYLECDGWTTIRWVWPLTGWWTDYRWIARRS